MDVSIPGLALRMDDVWVPDVSAARDLTMEARTHSGSMLPACCSRPGRPVDRSAAANLGWTRRRRTSSDFDCRIVRTTTARPSHFPSHSWPTSWQPTRYTPRTFKQRRSLHRKRRSWKEFGGQKSGEALRPTRCTCERSSYVACLSIFVRSAMRQAV